MASNPAPAALPRSAMKSDGTDDADGDKTPPHSGSIKAVQIQEPADDDAPNHVKQFSAGISRRLSGRPPPSASPSFSSVGSLTSVEELPVLAEDAPGSSPRPSGGHGYHYYHRKLLAQVSDWLVHEREKKLGRTKRKASRPLQRAAAAAAAAEDAKAETDSLFRPRTGSIDSQSSDVSLDRLQRIIEDSMSAMGFSPENLARPPSRRSSGKNLRAHRRSLQMSRTASSDTDYFDGDAVVPSCDGVLDNSRTLSYTGGSASTDDLSSISSRQEEKERQVWTDFKNEIIRLAHTLKLKGWRRVPLDSGEGVAVTRLSGALTNAVYVVTPPVEVVEKSQGRKPPQKLLLRVYGPNVECLIDREHELGVLQRLARKKIGPRLLGTFQNGRFEQYFNATTLTAANLREPETSRQIAKRMRELHEGVELLADELDGGPAVWDNWTRWLPLVEKRVRFLDRQLTTRPNTLHRGALDSWKANGFVCGTDWDRFKTMMERYRAHVEAMYRGSSEIRDRLVFAHNDTQYGNILRVRPDDETSPMLQPQHEHKQLVVIDFEYAAANLPGLEFANHFTEWCYNYHDPQSPFLCATSRYPSPEQQHRFVSAYVEHQPQFPSRTPTLKATPGSSSSIVEFMLDARVPPGGWKENERQREEQTEKKIDELLRETRLWRAANSAQWVAWGVVQAKIWGLDDNGDEMGGFLGDPPGDFEANTDEFDYLAYAQERAYFFWGDCVLMGLIKEEELPEEVRPRLKKVDY